MRTISPQALLHLVAQACAVAALGLSTSYALADAVFVTPGSLSGYTYYPPVKAGGGGGSGNASGRVETLQKCYVAIKSPDVSFSLQAAEFYGLENIRLYYKAAGGNGGTGTNGGGGGSTAIILNGSTAVIAPGGNGGQEAPVTKGDFQVAPGDSVRIVTGAVAARAGREFQVAVEVLAGAAVELAPAMPLAKVAAPCQVQAAAGQILALPAAATTAGSALIRMGAAHPLEIRRAARHFGNGQFISGQKVRRNQCALQSGGCIWMHAFPRHPCARVLMVCHFLWMLMQRQMTAWSRDLAALGDVRDLLPHAPLGAAAGAMKKGSMERPFKRQTTS
ncbi:hypothetical protein CHL79_25245 [Delftia acidovorans]|nr:hypothetical protein CHL79_25245 [Delftia acidovorans]